jgi:glycosyltransferase involved in cell wall biosynthesis
MKILHISPTFFSNDSIKGGAERYVDELACAMAFSHKVTVLSFSENPQSIIKNNVRYEIKKPLFYAKGSKLNPVSINFLKEIKNTDVVHIHQLFTLLTELVLVIAFFLRKPVFITDHGGGGQTYLTRFKISKFLSNGFLCVSNYSAQKLIDYHDVRIPIWGGMRQNEVCHNIDRRGGKNILTIGRFLQHKGMHHLIKALSDQRLYIVGSGGDSKYLKNLKEMAKGKDIIFKEAIDDSELNDLKKKCQLAIFASTNIGINGESLIGEPELLGLAPIECMGQNLPTIVSNIGAYPEIAFPNEKFIFTHGNVEELKRKIKDFFSQEENESFSNHVIGKFTWESAAQKCVESYRLYGEIE